MKILTILILLLVTIQSYSQVRESRFNEFSITQTGDITYINDSTLNLRGGLIPVAQYNNTWKIGTSSRSYLSPAGHAYKVEGNKVRCKKSGVLTINHSYVVGKSYYVQFEGTYDTVPSYPYVTEAFYVMDASNLFIKESLTEKLGSEGDLAEYGPFKGIMNYAPNGSTLLVNWTPNNIDSVVVYESTGFVDSIEFLSNGYTIENWSTNPANRDVTLETDGNGVKYLDFTSVAETGAALSANDENTNIGNDFTIICSFIPVDNSGKNYIFSREFLGETGLFISNNDLTTFRAKYEGQGEAGWSPAFPTVDFTGATQYTTAFMQDASTNEFRFYQTTTSTEHTYTITPETPPAAWTKINIGARTNGGNDHFSGKVYSFYVINRSLTTTQVRKLLDNYEKYR